MMHYSCPVSVLNMSLGGVAVRAPIRLNIGRDYALKLETKGDSSQVTATVIWSILSGMQKGPTGEAVPHYLAGLKFRDVLSEPMCDLVRFIGDNKTLNENRLTGMRFRIAAPGKVLVDIPQVYEVRLISLVGMLIKSEQNLTLEGTYPMELHPPGQPPIRFSGRVASSLEVAEEGPTYFEIGIEFTAITPEDRRRLDQFVETLSGH